MIAPSFKSTLPIPLATGDLKPIIPDETRQRIIALIVACVKSVPSCQDVQIDPLRSAITESFDRLCNGVRFDFRPIQRALLRDGTVGEKDAYIVAVRLAHQLARMNIVLAQLST